MTPEREQRTFTRHSSRAKIAHLPKFCTAHGKKIVSPAWTIRFSCGLWISTGGRICGRIICGGGGVIRVVRLPQILKLDPPTSVSGAVVTSAQPVTILWTSQSLSSTNKFKHNRQHNMVPMDTGGIKVKWRCHFVSGLTLLVSWTRAKYFTAH